MSSRCLRALLSLALALAAPLARADDAMSGAAGGRVLRVCADPDNLPFSKDDESGFENRIARIVAADLHATLVYAWLPQGRGFVRKSLGADLCDVLIGIPVEFNNVLATRPYYRSGYMFVNRADAIAPLTTFKDARLSVLTVGIQLTGDNPSTTPPGLALARHGAFARVVGYPVYDETPAAARATADLAAGRLDAALLWGPQAAYYATRSPVPLSVRPAAPPEELGLPFEFSIGMGVRKGDFALRNALDSAIVHWAAAIAAVLDAYAVPVWPLEDAPGELGRRVMPRGASIMPVEPVR